MSTPLPPEASVFRNWLQLSWKVVLVRGFIALGFGVAVMVWPKPTVVTVMVLWGLFALVEALALMAQSVRGGAPAGARIMFVVVGLLALVVGVLALTRPAMTASAVALVIGIWLLIRAAIEIVGAFSARGWTRGLLIGSAIANVVVGLIFITKPLALVFLIGLLLALWGLIFVVAGFVMRRMSNELQPTVGEVISSNDETRGHGTPPPGLT